jgi:hypothetical protein
VDDSIAKPNLLSLQFSIAIFCRLMLCFALSSEFFCFPEKNLDLPFYGTPSIIKQARGERNEQTDEDTEGHNYQAFPLLQATGTPRI